MSEETAQQLQAQVDLVLAAEGLGRSPSLDRLLRYLLLTALEGRAPKEAEIAEAVWARLPSDRDADASVRVYIHRLRRKLDQYYAGPGQGQVWRLTLPKGSYLLVLERVSPEPIAQDAEASGEPTLIRRSLFRRRLRQWAAIVALVVISATAGWMAGNRHQSSGQIETVRQSGFWSPILGGESRVALILGDYYIFGERDNQGNINRLIREFDVNSAKDLDDLKAMNPAIGNRYSDLDLTYLPVGVGSALRSVAPLLRTGDNDAAIIPVTEASRLNGQMVQNSAMVYLGYISGLGMLRAPTFDGSRFTVGTSFDEIIDQQTGKHYLASSHLEESDMPGEDYALVSSFKGLAGNRIIIIAGTRDAALMQAAEFVTKPDTVAQLDRIAHDGSAFEVLLGIPSMQNIGLAAHIIVQSARKNPSWTTAPNTSFPDQFHGPVH